MVIQLSDIHISGTKLFLFLVFAKKINKIIKKINIIRLGTISNQGVSQSCRHCKFCEMLYVCPVDI